MTGKKFDLSEIRPCAKSGVNFYSAPVKDISCTIRLQAKLELLSRASNKSHLNIFIACLVIHLKENCNAKTS